MGCLYVSAGPTVGVFETSKGKEASPIPLQGVTRAWNWLRHKLHFPLTRKQKKFQNDSLRTQTFFAQEPFYANWTIIGTPRKGQEPVSQASIILKMIQEPRKIETTAHRVSLYSCGLHVLQAQGLVVHNMNSLQIFTDFGFNIIGDELLLNFGTKFQP